jgi:hypothetical protein
MFVVIDSELQISGRLFEELGIHQFHAAHSSFVHAPIMILFLDASHGSAAPASLDLAEIPD